MVGLVWLCPRDRGQPATAPAISNQQADRGQGPATDLPSHLKDGKVSRENSWGVGMLDGRVVWWGQLGCV